MGVLADQIMGKLSKAFSPQALELVDDSEKHRGHAGHREGGESHFLLTIVSESFEGLSRLDRQRKVNAVLAEELKGAIHALNIKALTPAEASKL